MIDNTINDDKTLAGGGKEARSLAEKCGEEEQRDCKPRDYGELLKDFLEKSTQLQNERRTPR